MHKFGAWSLFKTMKK